MFKLSLFIASALFLFLTGAAAAQQAGTADYNRRYLPAHGAGDTRGVQTWGAMAKGQGDAIGWITDAATEDEAAERAMKQCNFGPARPCSVRFTFVNSCGVFAANKDHGRSSSGGTGSLESHRRRAIKECGSDCKIYREGCAGRQR